MVAGAAEAVQEEAVWPFLGTGGADGHGAAEPDLQRAGGLRLWHQSRHGEADHREGARAQTAVRQCAGCRSRGYSHRGGGAPPAGERTDLFCLWQQIGGDWQGSPPQLNDEAGRVLGARGRVLHLRLQELRAGDRRGQHCKGSERACAAARQLCLRGGGGESGSTEIRHVLAAVPAGTGIQPSGLEAVPADDGQLAVEGLREVAAASLRCAA